MYGIKNIHDAEKGEDDDNEDNDDIEAAIQKELAALNSNRKGTDGGHNFTPLKMNVDCLLFVKTKAPIEPTAFVRRICEDAKLSAESGQMKCRYVNRLTPVTVTGKATEQGLADVAREALEPFFDLGGKRKPAVEGEGDNGKDAHASQTTEAEAEKEKPKAEESENDNGAQSKENKGFTVSCPRVAVSS